MNIDKADHFSNFYFCLNWYDWDILKFLDRPKP